MLVRLNKEIWKDIALDTYSEVIRIRFLRRGELDEADEQKKNGGIFNEAFTKVLARLYMRREDLPPGALALIWRYWPGNAEYYQKVRNEPLRFANHR